MDGYISFAEATAGQADALEALIPRLDAQLTSLRGAGALSGPAPVLLGIGASLAAAAPAVWHLRARGIGAWRLGAGDTPLPLTTGDHPVLGISQSGRSSETIAALQTVDPPLRYGVVNTTPSPLADLAGRLIELGNVPDSYASTIGYTATVSALSMFAEAWNGGTVDPGWHGLAAVFRRAGSESEFADALDTAAASFAGASSADFVGAGPSAGSAEAGALLFREAARIPSTAMGTRQYLHGSMESAGDSVHVLFGGDREALVGRMLADAGHAVVLVTEEEFEAVDRLAIIRLPRSSDTARAVLEALVMQGLVHRAARLRGVDIEEFVFHNDDTKIETGDGAA